LPDGLWANASNEAGGFLGTKKILEAASARQTKNGGGIDSTAQKNAYRNVAYEVAAN
jgi:hypothetical protein